MYYKFIPNTYKFFKMSSHPIGPKTVNRTANLPVRLDLDLGRLAGALDKSKSELLKRLVRGLVSGAIRTSQLGLVIFFGAGFGLALGLSMQPETDLIRAYRRSGPACMVRVIKGEAFMNFDLSVI